MIKRWAAFVLLCGVGFAAAGCGGGKPAESADDTAADKSADAKPSETSDKTSEAKSDAGSSDAQAANAKKPSEPKDDSPKPTRTPEDIITAPDVVFLFSFNDSDPKKAAEEKCSSKAGSDAKKMNECMSAARKAFPADGYRFKKDEREQWWWITVRQKGNRLIALHKIPVEFIEPTENSVTLKPVGKDKGSAPMTPPSKVVFEVPNDYQIAIQDPKAGRLVFQAKIGVVSE